MAGSMLACIACSLSLDLSGFAVQRVVDPVPNLLRHVLGHAEHAGDDLDGERAGEVLHGVEAVRVERGRDTCSTLSITLSLCAWIARGVNTLLSRLRMCRCVGGSMKMIDSWPVSVGSPFLIVARSSRRPTRRCRGP